MTALTNLYSVSMTWLDLTCLSHSGENLHVFLSGTIVSCSPHVILLLAAVDPVVTDRGEATQHLLLPINHT